jgi:asparagine synthase (glutamine-hydrolysing)
MSAIAGIYHADGRPVAKAEMERMLGALAHRGPDDAGLWCAGGVGLGHRMLRTTPESAHERLPLVRDDLVITAEVRLDNRSELIHQLGIEGRPPESIGDTEILLAAYERWGEECVERLLGDFAFVIWDGRRRRLFGARDHFGVKPFYYYFREGRFCFASEIKGLLCLPDLSPRLNTQRVIDYLVVITCDVTETFYEGIYRLPPGQCIVVEPKALRRRTYWQLDPTREIRLGSDREYAEAFRSLFEEAVRCRLRSATGIGAELSGGLDSSSVTCVARSLLSLEMLPLPTFSATYESLSVCDERRYIDTVLARGGYEPHFLRGDVLDLFGTLEEVFQYQDEAFVAPGLFVTWEICRLAAAQGTRVLLSGHDGDGTVYHGEVYLKELAKAGRWWAVAREVKGPARLRGDSPARWLWPLWLAHGPYGRLQKTNLGRAARRIFRAARRRCTSMGGTAPRPPLPALCNAYLRPGLLADPVLRERYERWRSVQPGAARTAHEAHYRVLMQPLQPLALEILDRTAAAFGLEYRYPFWDRRLVEFCLAIPAAQKLHGGWTRWVLRQAMSGTLPDAICWRPDKVDFTPNIRRTLVGSGRASVEAALVGQGGTLGRYLDLPALRKAYVALLSDPGIPAHEATQSILRAVHLARWLQGAGFSDASEPFAISEPGAVGAARFA